MGKFKELIIQYPYLAPTEHTANYYLEGEETWLDYVPKGWHHLFFKMLDGINDILNFYKIPLESFVFLQVKEKFGSLRTYWALEAEDHPNCASCYDELDILIQRTEDASSFFCHNCGDIATLQSKGWILPYCELCAQINLETRNIEHPHIVATMESDFKPINPI